MSTPLPLRFAARVAAGLGCSWLGFTGDAQSDTTPQVTPTPTNATITIDGILDEEAWSQASSIQNFLGFEPAQGADHPGVDAKFLFDDEAIYVGWRVHQMEANGPQQLNAPLAPRDVTLRHDWVGIVLDTFQDERRAFVFRSTARGIQADGIYVEGDSHLWMQDLSWDGVFDSAGVVHKVGSAESVNGEAVYTVELAIPFRSLRYPATPAQEWGVVLVHFTPKPWGLYTWPYLSKDQSGVLTQAATLGPFEAPPPKPQIEVLPTLTALSGDLVNPSDEDSPSIEPGVSARVGITSSLTADLTVNPDFSQIEADEDQVTANVKFPLYYKEKRPFFLESSDLFQTPIEAFYSRSIVDPLAGTKVTGRVGRVGLGVVSAHDQTPAPSSISTDYATGDELDGWGDEEVEGATATVNIGRSQADLGNGNSVGMLFADKELWTTQQGRLANRVVGVDAVGRVGEHHMFTGQILGSQTDLCDGSMLMGPAWDFGWDRSGQIFTAELHHGVVSNEFRSETGFIEEVGRIFTEGEVDWRLEKVGNFRFLGPGMDAEILQDTRGQVVQAETGPSIEALWGGSLFTMQHFRLVREKFLGETFDMWRVKGFNSITATSHLFFQVGWEFGPEPHYAAETMDELYLGFGRGGFVQMRSLSFNRLDIQLRSTIQQFLEPADDTVVYNTLIHYLRANLNITRPLSVRLIEEWNGYEEELNSSVLVAYQRNYGTAAYVGASATTSLEGMQPVERSVFAKLSYLWQPGS